MCLFSSRPLCCRVWGSLGLAVVWIVLSLSSSFTAQHRDPDKQPLCSFIVIYTHKHTLTPLFSAVSPRRHQETNRRLKNVSEKKIYIYIVCVFVCECDPLPLTSGYLEKSWNGLWASSNGTWFTFVWIWSQNGREKFLGCVPQHSPFLCFEAVSLRQNKPLIA